MDIESMTAHFENLAVPMAVADTSGTMLEANSAFCDYLGYSRSEMLKMKVFDYTHPDDLQRTKDFFARVRKGKVDHFTYQKKYQRKDGQTVWAVVTTSWVPATEAVPSLCVAVIQDVSSQVLSQDRLQKSEELHRTLLDNINLGVALIDESNRIMKVNRATADMFEKEPSDFTEKICFREFERREDVCEHCPGLRALKDGIPHTVETEGVRENGSRFMVKIRAAPVFDPDGQARKFIEVVEDITEKYSLEAQVKQNQAQLNYLAHHDQLTGLPNRTLLYDRLSHALELAKRQKERVTVIVFDIDRFRKINQSLGFSIGNQVLKEISRRLKRHLRKTDSLCRMGGTEFVMVLEINGTSQRASRVARRILHTLNHKPFDVGGQDIHITASVGISQYPGDGEDVETLLSSAEIARVQARQAGGNSYRYFEAESERDSRHLLQLEHQLHDALESDRIRPHYQPQVNAITGEITGLEALARWIHPERGVVSPAEFIPLAEETGLIAPLGRRVLEDACRQGRQWLDAGLLRFRISVNVSAIQIAKGHFVETVKNVLRKTGLPAVFLEIEITESVLMNDPELALTTLIKLKKLGLSIALDDFGTGYSALSYLKTFPFDHLKIDQGFIRNVPYNDHDASIVEAILAMSKKLGIDVVAEGVETADHLRRLLELGCPRMQGYYFSRPLDPETLTERLTQWLGPEGACPLDV